MAAIPLVNRGLNIVLVVFSLLFLGGGAYVMDQNYQTNLKTGASDVISSATGKLVKKGTPAFSPCKNIISTYALVGAQPETSINAGNIAPDKTNTPAPACTPLAVSISLAEPLLGERVIALGAYRNGIFYATNLRAFSVTPSAKPTSPAKPTVKPSANPSNPAAPNTTKIVPPSRY